MVCRLPLSVLSCPCLMGVLAGAGIAQAKSIEERLRALLPQVRPARLEQTVRDLVAFGTRHVASATDDAQRGTGAARSYLMERFEQIAAKTAGRLVVERKSYRVPSRRLRKEVEVVNIVATLRGETDPERLYVMGGHYDSINSNPRDGKSLAPGANDDASGTAAVLEACRVLSAERFGATIVFVAYDGEEMGLLGSAAHAKELEAAEAKVDAMLTNDIVGNTRGMDGVVRNGYVRCFSYAPRGNDSMGRSLARVASRAARRYLADSEFAAKLVLRGDRYGRGGDHRPFFRAGYPAIRLTEPREDYSRQHRDVRDVDGKPYGDLPDYMDFAYLAQVCRLNVAVLGELAAAPRPLQTVRVRGARDRYAIDVRFVPLPDPAVRYELVWRDTTAADWAGVRLLGEGDLTKERRGMRATLEGQSIDDVIVGVRSVAPNGARSRVQIPPEPDAFDLGRGR